MNNQSENNQQRQKRLLQQYQAKKQAEKKQAEKNDPSSDETSTADGCFGRTLGCLGLFSFFGAFTSPFFIFVFILVLLIYLAKLVEWKYIGLFLLFIIFCIVCIVCIVLISLTPHISSFLFDCFELIYNSVKDLILIFPVIIPLFWLLIRQAIIFLAQFLILHFGFPSHWNKRIDQALGSLFGFLIIAVVWELPGPLSLGPLNDLWVRLSLTIMTLLFLIFTYLTQDFLPKRRLIRRLSSQDGDLRQQAAESLRQMEPKDLADIRPEVKQKMIKTLSQMGSQAIPALIQLLKDQNSTVQETTAILRQIGPATVAEIPALIQLLENQSVTVRLNAAKALAEIGPEAKPAVPVLIQLLEDQNSEVRSQAARSLGEIGPEAKPAIPFLIQLLEDPSSGIRSNIIEALRLIGPATVTEVSSLIQLLSDESTYTRSNAIRTLGAIGPEAKDSVPALIQLSEDQNQNLRHLAQEAITKIIEDQLE